MAKKKKPLTRVQRLRRRDSGFMLFTLALILIPVILMVLRLWIPGRAFS